MGRIFLEVLWVLRVNPLVLGCDRAIEAEGTEAEVEAAAGAEAEAEAEVRREIRVIRVDPLVVAVRLVRSE